MISLFLCIISMAIAANNIALIYSRKNDLNETHPVSFINTEDARSRGRTCIANKLLSVIMLYHNECSALRYQSTIWSKFPAHIKRNIEILVIDDHSRIPAAECLLSGETKFIRLLRVDSNTTWNIGGGRNLGAYVACTPFFYFTDIDTVFNYELASTLLAMEFDDLKMLKDGKALIQFNRHFDKTSIIPDRASFTHTHPGVMLMTREMYWKVNGCDEDFVGT
jgi:hypothetical protein